MAREQKTVMGVAAQIVAEFRANEEQRGTRYRTQFRDPASSKRVIQNSVGVRVSLLRALSTAIKQAGAI